jgi:transposase
VIPARAAKPRDKAKVEVGVQLTFRTLFRTAEAILEEPPAENGGGAIYRRCYVL